MLRKPLKLPRDSEQDELENSSFHIAAYQDDVIIGVGRVHTEADNTGRIRYMAVHDDFQNQGIGSNTLGKLEDFACTNNLQASWLYARENVINFYLKNGYEIKGKGDSELKGIKHARMEKQLA